MIEISQSLRSSHNSEGAVLLDIAGGKMYGLNPVASRILALLAQGLGEDQIKSEISRAFSVDIEVVGSDVDEFLAQLAEHRLITRNGNRNTKP
jgi:hypothetical protein